MVRLISTLLLMAVSIPAASRLEVALDLERQGKLKESEELLRSAIVELRADADGPNLVSALSASGRVSVSLGDYKAAIRDAAEAIEARTEWKIETKASDDFNTLGLANLYLGNYDEALLNYETALKLDRAHHDAEGEVMRENNIGNVYYFRGRYLDALRSYQLAFDKVNASAGGAWIPWRRQLTIANLATLYQRLGKEQQALELYQQLTGKPQAMPRNEYAQLLLNEGVLYRRMGDPIKALEQYRSSQALFATERHRDGEIGALRNIGIARAVDLDDLAGALDSFNAALRLARQSSDTRGIVQIGLYRGEVLRRLDRMREAEDDFHVALEGAQKTGLAEEQWKAQYGLGKIEEAAGRTDAASELYRKAIAGIESVRAGIRLTSLRSEFLADKRDVYDSVISLALRQPAPQVDTIFSWIERSRARTFEERSRSAGAAVESTIRETQARLRPETILLDLWVGTAGSATLWISNSGAGIVPHDLAFGQIQEAASGFERSIQNGDDAWRDLSRVLGKLLLAGVPSARHVVVAPDGPLSILPFELLTDPASGALLIERSDVSYLPAARFLSLRAVNARKWLPPWRTQLLAFGDPPVSSADTFADAGQWSQMPAAAEEVNQIAQILPGRSEIHLGAAARKRDLFARVTQGVSLLHFSTHAVVDTENPDRSRILMAPNSPSAPFDYLFQQEVYGLDLRGVDLVTVSACDTARGKAIRGDGVEAFSLAFMAAGAGATITSLWKVADRPTADFMKQLYYFLARGQSKSEALRSAKLQFLHSPSALHNPRYWAAFVLYGDGWDRCVRVLPWSYFIAAAGGALLLCAWLFRRLR